jgi:hypothetical protein
LAARLDKIMQTNPSQTALNYIAALQWPVVVLAAFFLGRMMTRLETRVLKAEKNVQDLIERHMPHIYKALDEIKGALAVMAARIR